MVHHTNAFLVETQMLRSILAISGLIAAVPAVAQAPAPSRPLSSKAKDPNKTICEKVEIIGSRISSKRVCMTAAQWDEQKRLNREVLQQAQQNTGIPTAN